MVDGSPKLGVDLHGLAEDSLGDVRVVTLACPRILSQVKCRFGDSCYYAHDKGIIDTDVNETNYFFIVHNYYLQYLQECKKR